MLEKTSQAGTGNKCEARAYRSVDGYAHHREEREHNEPPSYA